MNAGGFISAMIAACEFVLTRHANDLAPAALMQLCSDYRRLCQISPSLHAADLTQMLADAMGPDHEAVQMAREIEALTAQMGNAHGR